MTTIADRLAIAQQRIINAAQLTGRNSSEIRLLAVSKTKPIADIITAYEAGQRQFGENYVQEGVDKITTLSTQYPEIEWHFIGPLQSNKSRLVASHFDWMHTLSREKIAQRLNDYRPSEMAPLNVCIQVNISAEETKSGIDIHDILPLANAIHKMPRLRLRGLMAIGSTSADVALQQHEFSTLNQAFAELKSSYPHLDTLSMGMSGDLDAAIANGSTLVRIGSAIFGERHYSDSI
ncbi:YggS family pyridoxal phosphate-dependent enzyme [Shewanella sp. NIFS-20-20]|uniref:YggS family pyridoxal phosphate-dependent enzyme n=1 Tax=Shewanella sp. NIFS-20-20 TaxID=2853806 RepID=UPI001C45E674|nr:YggS family pyridoxal phosphate-dependent enzyme [Shewanella sp. NIFS-20-20]MBV7316620.1 YggS family pyridoxal phosphate-dependent enzyme [Shewanella sp. NIFS-20-20]